MRTTVRNNNSTTSHLYDIAIMKRKTKCGGVIYGLNEQYEGIFNIKVSDHLPVTFFIKFSKSKKK